LVNLTQFYCAIFREKLIDEFRKLTIFVFYAIVNALQLYDASGNKIAVPEVTDAKNISLKQFDNPSKTRDFFAYYQ
jgi:hypothetical protein